MAATRKAPRGPRTARSSGMNKSPSEAREALQAPLEPPETASAGQGLDDRLKRRGSGVIRDTETAKAKGRAGGLASAAARRKRREMREYLEIALRMTDEDTGESNAMEAALALVREAKRGNVKAWDAILAAVGEKAAQLVDVRSGDGSMSPGRDLTALPFDQLMALARAEWGQDAEGVPAVEAMP